MILLIKIILINFLIILMNTGPILLIVTDFQKFFKVIIQQVLYFKSQFINFIIDLFKINCSLLFITINFIIIAKITYFIHFIIFQVFLYIIIIFKITIIILNFLHFKVITINYQIITKFNFILNLEIN